MKDKIPASSPNFLVTVLVITLQLLHLCVRHYLPLSRCDLSFTHTSKAYHYHIGPYSLRDGALLYL